ncbi:octopamine receptor beta-1R-like [Liolophura sinensis]|uniref:octopamine receptor beta-1R-like n=1 Tax=Liolophura sinensis TaxID=3198878 RepID=UPI00315829D4
MLPGNFCNTSMEQSSDTEMWYSVCSKDSVGFLVYYLGFLFTITVINVIGNILVISTFVRHPKLQQPCNYFITSLAVSDLFAGIVYTLYNLAHLESIGLRESLGGWTVCSLLLWVVQGFQFSSAYHLVGITVSRYIMVTSPLCAERYLTAPRVALSLVVIWTVSNFVSAGLYIAFTPQDNYPSVCRYELIYTMWHIYGTMIYAVVLPFLIMMGLYFRIASIAKKQAKLITALENIQTAREVNTRKSSTLRESKSTRMIATLLGCFFLGWMPFILYVIVKLGCSTCVISKYIRATSRLFLHMNSAVNIFIYAGRLSEFRSALRKDLSKIRLWPATMGPCVRVSPEVETRSG